MHKSVSRRGLEQAIEVLLNTAIKNYELATKKKMDAKTLAFLKEVIVSLVDLVETGTRSGLGPKEVGRLALQRAAQITGLLSDDDSMIACALALGGLASATVEVFGIMAGAAAMSGTGAGAAIGVPLFLASAAFYSYQVDDAVQVCGESYVKYVENQYQQQNLASQRMMITSYANQVCKIPDQAAAPLMQAH